MLNPLIAAPRDSLDADAEITQPVLRDNDRSAAEWLQAFVAHECDLQVLLQRVTESVTTTPDEGWDLLTWLDQYYRRDRISAADFRTLNTRLQALLLSSPPAQGLDCKPPVPPRGVVVGEELRSRYRVQAVLGRGGMGTVYAALDQLRLNDAKGGQRVAIKVLNIEATARSQTLRELQTEFQRLQSLSHPNIVRVHDLDRDGELVFFTMEHLSGASLGRILDLRNGAAPERAHAQSIIHQVGAAVAYAHSRFIVHGDLNPRNIFITDSGEVRLLDFGASHRLASEPANSALADPARIPVATFNYASCELLQGRVADTRADVYSLACISYVLLTGKHPFQGRTALVARTLGLTPRRPAGLNARQWRALQAGLQFDMQRRPGDLQRWLDELNAAPRFTSLPPLSAVMSAQPQKRGDSRWLKGSAIAVVAGACWWAQQDSDLVARASAVVAGTAAGIRDRVADKPVIGARADSPAALARDGGSTTVPPAATAAQPEAESTMVPVTAVSGSATAAAIPGASEPIATAAPGITTSLAHIELAADSLEVAPLQAVASVVVHRRHNYRKGVSFSWWTEAGTARAGQDFVAVKARTDYIPAGENETRLLVPLVADPRRHLSKSFYVLVGDPSADAALGSRTITMVTLSAVN